MNRPRRAALLATSTLALSAATLGAVSSPALADGYDPGNPAYSSYNAAQYDRPVPLVDDSVGSLAISALDVDSLVSVHDVYDGSLRPAEVVYRKARIVNDLAYPVTVHYAGGGDTGSIADYLFEWLSGWSDVTLRPGEASPVFELQLGMPADAPNASQSTSGTYWWEWTVRRLAQPVAADDSASTPFATEVRVDVLANDRMDDETALPDGARVTAVQGLTGQGAWTIGPDGTSVVFAPAAGFSGTATAVYTVEVPGIGTAQAVVTVTVGPPGLSVHTGGAASSGSPGLLGQLAEWLGMPR